MVDNHHKVEFSKFLENVYDKHETFHDFKNHVNNVLKNRNQRKANYSRLPTNYKSAGVLFALIYPKSFIDDTKYLQQIHLLLEKRSKHMKSHPGDMAFPGGTQEEEDMDLIETAYRESREEVGLDTNKLHFVAYMDEFISSSNILVHPIVSWFPVNSTNTITEFRNLLVATYSPKSNESEATAFIPVSHFLNPTNYSSKPWMPNGIVEGFIRFFDIDQYLPGMKIWGLTATMIRRFVDEVFPSNLLPVEELPK